MIFKPAHLLVALLVSASLPVMAQNLAVVNGQPIPASRANLLIKQMVAQGQKDTPKLREMVKEQLINREILEQEANKQGLGKSAAIKNQMALAKQSILINALVSKQIKNDPVTDAEVKTEYDRFHAQASDKEYHARHILVDTEDEAKAIIAKLKAGAKFEDLAKQSKDPGTASKGGDLGWAVPAAYVKSFSDAMVGLKKGELLEIPVKSKFGYHVIRLDDVRATKIPTLEQVTPQIKESLQQKKLQEYQDALHAKAKIK